MPKTIKIICILLCIASIAIAQNNNNSSQKEWIVLLQPNANIESLLAHIPTNQKSNPIVKKTLSSSMKIYLLEGVSKSLLLQQKEIKAIQANHTIQLRTNPNDYFYGNQWALDTIQVQEAWQYTTGGLSPNQDSIVVGVIDGSFDVTHEDLQENIWHNYAEIPNNNIDDDNNGFVDDYTGWQTVFDTDRHDYGSISNHGTSVLGIIGAKGNNNIGVSGINWDIKLLLLSAHTQNEITKLSNIIKAYSYILEMRRRYNKTNGQEGAYIVVTNASWGVDYAKAENNPIWCALYDSLGNEGILSVAATANSTINVDKEGDMPCSCSSKFLVTVHESSNLDKLKNDTGFGKTTIDLAAPASSTSTRWANNYGVFGGTSGAAPHVTGAIALLYSYPNPAWGLMQRSRPKDAANLVKSILLNSVDIKPTFRDKSVSNGRLNLSKAMQQLVDYFSVPEQTQLLVLYPSPATSTLTAKLALAKEGSYQVNFYDRIGKKIKSTQINATAPTINYYYFDIEDFSKGMYILEFLSEDSRYTTKFIKR